MVPKVKINQLPTIDLLQKSFYPNNEAINAIHLPPPLLICNVISYQITSPRFPFFFWHKGIFVYVAGSGPLN